MSGVLQPMQDPRDILDRLRRVHLIMLLEHAEVPFSEELPATAMRELCRSNGILGSGFDFEDYNRKRNFKRAQKLKPDEEAELTLPNALQEAAINKMDIKELKALATERGITFAANAKRDKMISLLNG